MKWLSRAAEQWDKTLPGCVVVLAVIVVGLTTLGTGLAKWLT